VFGAFLRGATCRSKQISNKLNFSLDWCAKEVYILVRGKDMENGIWKEMNERCPANTVGGDGMT